MKHLALKLLFLLLSFTLVAAAKEITSYKDNVYKLQVPKKNEEWKNTLEEMKKQSKTWVETQSTEALTNKLSHQERDATLIALLWPELFATKISFYKQYAECAKLHHNFINKPDQQKFDDWKNCVEFSAGRESKPEVFEFLAKNYSLWLSAK